jgi:replicative DNA helicase
MNKRLQIEAYIICILLNKPELLSRGVLESRWFSEYRAVIDAMFSLSKKGTDIDLLTLKEILGTEWGVEIYNIYKNSFASEKNYDYYISLLKIEFKKDFVKNCLNNAMLKINDDNETPESVLSEVLTQSMEMSDISARKYDYSMKEINMAVINDLEELLEKKSSGGIGIKTGIDVLDKTLGSLHPSDLCVIGARPAVGKTSFALSVIKNIMESGGKGGFFSTEMNHKQVGVRFNSLVSGIFASKFRDASFNDQDYSAFSASMLKTSNMQLRVYDKPAIKISEIVMQSRIWMDCFGLDFIFIDYLTRLQPDKLMQNQNLLVGEMITSLKNLARTLNIPVIVLAQLNRQSANRANKIPQMSDLRDSGVIEQEADQIILLHRDEESGDLVIIEKNRHGACGDVRCIFKPEIMQWTSPDNYYAD